TPVTRSRARARRERRLRRRRTTLRVVTQAVVLTVVAGGTVAFATSDVVVPDGPLTIAGSTLDLRAALTHPSRAEADREDLGSVVVHVDGDRVAVPLGSATADGPVTVRDVLAAAGVVLGEHDEVSVPLGTELDPTADDVAVHVTRVETHVGSETTTQPFETVREDDGSLQKGREVVVREGREGLSVVAYEARLVDGEEVSRTVLASRVVREPVHELVRVGTFEPPPPGVAVEPGTARAIGREMVLARGWGDDQWQCLDALWTRESGWRTTAENRSSGAYGIPQALPGSKMASVGDDWRTNPATQITWGLGYIANRYSTPCGAWAHFQARNWY